MPKASKAAPTEAPVADLIGEPLVTKYVPLRTAVLWEKNPKEHDFGAIIQSIEENGFVDPPKFDAMLEALVYGNGRAQGCMMMFDEGKPRPRGVLEDAEGEWYIPIHFGVDANSKRAAERFAIDHNNLTLIGGRFGPNDLLRMYDEQRYKDVLKDLAADDLLPITVDREDFDALLRMDETKGDGEGSGDGGDKGGGEQKHMILIECADEGEQTSLLERLIADGLKCRALVS